MAAHGRKKDYLLLFLGRARFPIRLKRTSFDGLVTR